MSLKAGSMKLPPNRFSFQEQLLCRVIPRSAVPSCHPEECYLFPCHPVERYLFPCHPEERMRRGISWLLAPLPACIPKYRFLTFVRNDIEESMSSQGVATLFVIPESATPNCHPEECYLFPCHPEERYLFPCHPEERMRRGISWLLAPLPACIPKCRFLTFVRNDIGESMSSQGVATLFVIPESATFSHVIPKSALPRVIPESATFSRVIPKSASDEGSAVGKESREKTEKRHNPWSGVGFWHKTRFSGRFGEYFPSICSNADSSLTLGMTTGRDMQPLGMTTVRDMQWLEMSAGGNVPALGIMTERGPAPHPGIFSARCPGSELGRFSARHPGSDPGPFSARHPGLDPGSMLNG